MSASDSNIVVRLFANDDTTQVELIVELLSDARSIGERLFVSNIVLCESLWTLATRYRFGRDRIDAVVATLIASDEFMLEAEDDVRAALDAFRSGRGDFADYLIRERARRAGALSVATFDKDVMHEEGFAGPAAWRRRRDDRVSEKTPRYGRRRRGRRSSRR